MPRKRKQLCHVMSASTASGSPIDSSVRPAGSSRSMAGKSDKTLGPATASGPTDLAPGITRSSRLRHAIYDTFDDEKRMI
jgi:hypothetical protein